MIHCPRPRLVAHAPRPMPHASLSTQSVLHGPWPTAAALTHPPPPAWFALLQKGEGPIAVIAAPTRELAEQIHKEARE